MGDVVERLTEITVEVAGRAIFGLTTDRVVADLEAIVAAESRLAAARVRLVRELEGRDFARGQGAPSVTVWLRDHLRMSNTEAHRSVMLGRLLHERPAIDAAMEADGLNAEQARVIGAALNGLPDNVDLAVRDRAEAVLLEQARLLDPGVLAKLGQRVLAHVAPEIAEEALRRLLERDEARARQARTFTLSPLGEGRTRLSGWLDTEAAAIVRAAIDPLSKPMPGDDGPDLRSPGQRRADALVEVCRLGLASADLPDAGGQRPQVCVTVEFDMLRRALGAGHLDTGELLSPAAMRRVACDASIIPVVLGGDGAVLEVGRARRLFTGAVRRALVLRDGGCAFPGCDRPPRWCAGHHIVGWTEGGPTCPNNGVLLCHAHHRVIHSGTWQVRMGADKRPEFIPPAHIDPARNPRRNHHRGLGPGTGHMRHHPRT